MKASKATFSRTLAIVLASGFFSAHASAAITQASGSGLLPDLIECQNANPPKGPPPSCTIKILKP